MKEDTIVTRQAQRPNSSLSEEEKSAKRKFKKLLKQRKYDARFQQAIEWRADEQTIECARRELQDNDQHLQEEEGIVARNSDFQEVESFRKARDFVISSVYHPLISIIQANQSSVMDKQHQTHQARELLHNMNKGSHTEHMFNNENALLGYTRQKFIEKAMVVVKSLEKLQQPTTSTTTTTQNLRDRVLSVRNVLSVGCGPGNDVVGFLAFLSAHQPNHTLQRVLLMDYVMPQWKELILDPLISLLVPDFVPRIDTVVCDVRYSLEEEANQSALAQLTAIDSETSSDMDLIIVSYLITETRGKWHVFFKDLISKVLPGTLLLLIEPNSWQLHQFLELYGDRISYYEWLDSSRETPELQHLQGRIGPAVLLACVK